LQLQHPRVRHAHDAAEVEGGELRQRAQRAQPLIAHLRTSHPRSHHDWDHRFSATMHTCKHWPETCLSNLTNT
jgi:hypothetical protein